jgi:hypothetical protein
MGIFKKIKISAAAVAAGFRLVGKVIDALRDGKVTASEVAAIDEAAREFIALLKPAEAATKAPA